MSVKTKLVIGAGMSAQTVTADDLVSVSTVMSSSIDGGEVAVDTLTVIVLDVAGGPAWAQLAHGTRVDYMEGADLIGRFYVTGVFRVAKKQYQIKCVSAFGMLDDLPHAGGIYGGQTVEEVLDEIIGDTVPYGVDQTVAGWIVGGWLPYDTARANLHRLLLALGINMLRQNGNPYFGLLDSEHAVEVDDDDVYMGGEVGQAQPATSVAITEHQYLQLPGERVVLHDSTDGSSGEAAAVVIFDGPHYDLQASPGLTVLAANANYAKVQGIGTLTGVPYTTTQRVVRLDGPAAQTSKEISVTDDGLVNPYNSVRVAQRLLDYYSSVRTIQGRLRIRPGSEVRPGTCIELTDAFGEPARAMVAKMNITASATVAASIEAVVGYQSGQSGNTYTDYRVIDADGTFEAPTGHLRIILIGGAQGGQGGYNGERGAGGDEDPIYGSVKYPMYSGVYDGMDLRFYKADLTSGGTGGEGGAGGASGNVLVLDVDVMPGDIISCHVGGGGAGGTANGGIGAPGQPTTVTIDGVTYSTADGAPSNLGIWDPLGTGLTLAAPGNPGIKGGDGGASTATQPRGWDGGDGTDGQDVGTNTGGTGGAGQTGDRQDGSHAGGSGAGGGGAAHGGNGTNGTSGSCIVGTSSAGYNVSGGTGGNGAAATPPPAAAYGCGGNGGNGGGGGGNAGGCHVYGDASVLAASTITPGAPGLGGAGSVGGAGGDGVILIMWDAYGRTMAPTRLGPMTVEQRQSVSASAAGAQLAQVDTGAEMSMSVAVDTQEIARPEIVEEIHSGGKLAAGVWSAAAPALTGQSVHSVIRTEAAAAGGSAATPEPQVVTSTAKARARNPNAETLPGGVDRVDTRTIAKSAALAGEILPHGSTSVATGVGAGAGTAGSARPKGRSLSAILDAVAVSLWGRWAWKEGDTLFIDQDFGGATQTGGLLAID